MTLLLFFFIILVHPEKNNTYIWRLRFDRSHRRLIIKSICFLFVLLVIVFSLQNYQNKPYYLNVFGFEKRTNVNLSQDKYYLAIYLTHVVCFHLLMFYTKKFGNKQDVYLKRSDRSKLNQLYAAAMYNFQF